MQGSRHCYEYACIGLIFVHFSHCGNNLDLRVERQTDRPALASVCGSSTPVFHVLLS